MKGTQVALFVISFALAVSALVGLGFTSWIGAGGTVGLQDDVDEFSDRDPSADNSGGIVPFITGSISLISNGLWTVVAKSGAALTNMGIPAPIAYAIQTAIDISMLVLIASVFARMPLTN